MGRQILPVICFNKHLLEETEQWERDDGRAEPEKRQKWQNYRKSGKQVRGCRLAVIKDNICWLMIQPDFPSADLSVNVFLVLLQDKSFQPAWPWCFRAKTFNTSSTLSGLSHQAAARSDGCLCGTLRPAHHQRCHRSGPHQKVRYLLKHIQGTEGHSNTWDIYILTGFKIQFKCQVFVIKKSKIITNNHS